MDAVRIRAAEPREEERLREIAIASKAYWGYERDQVQRWGAALDFSGKELYVAEATGRAVGYVALTSQRDVCVLDELWVEPEWIGKGVGSRLFRFAAERAGEHGARRLEWESDPNAVGFYERMGGRYLRDSEPSEWGQADPAGDGDRPVRIAALYDIHGNLPALEAVLAELEADVVVVGGDAASGPMPVETLERLRSQPVPVHFVRGNADRVLDLEGIPEPNRTARLWVAERLGDENLRFLAEFPLDVVLDVEGLGRVRFCHGAPGSDELTITKVTPDERLRRLLAGVEEDLVVCGHTHVQFDRSLDGIRIINAGSVGAPYESDPAAYWLELGPDVRFRRTDYDVEAAAEQMRATGYPNLGYLGYLFPDPSRPERMSALIEEGAS